MELFQESSSRQQKESALKLKKISMLANESVSLFPRAISVLIDFKAHLEKEIILFKHDKMEFISSPVTSSRNSLKDFVTPILRKI